MKDMIGKEVVVGDYIAMVTRTNPKMLNIYCIETIRPNSAYVKDHSLQRGRNITFGKDNFVWVDSNYVMLSILEK